MSNSITNLGKYLFLVPFLMFGINHFTKADMMAGMVPKMFPGGVAWVYLTGAAMLAFVVSALLGKYDKFMALAMALMCLVFVLAIHLPSVMDGTNPMAMPNLLKDLGLAGGALMFAGAYARDNSIVG